MQYSYVDNERSGSLLAMIVVFTIVLSAGFGLMCWANSGSKSAAGHPSVQQSAPMGTPNGLEV